MFQTSDLKLQREILSKDLNIKAAIKAGLALEQSKIKQDNMNLSKSQEEEVRVLFLDQKKRKATRINYDICMFPTYTHGKCQAKDWECFSCRKTGHFSRSRACKKKTDTKPGDKIVKEKKKY